MTIKKKLINKKILAAAMTCCLIASLVLTGATLTTAQAATPATTVTGVTKTTINGKTAWWNLVNGKVVKGPTVAQNSSGWWYINSAGYVDFNYSGFARNGSGTWYVTGGKVAFDTTSVIKAENVSNSGLAKGGWYNVVKDKLTPGITVAKNSSGWWYIDKNARVDFNYTGFAKNGSGTWYVTKGKVAFDTTDIVQAVNISNSGLTKSSWYNVVKDKLTYGPTVVNSSSGWWYIDKTGKKDTSYTGIATNSSGTWYCQSGKVTFKYNGTIQKGDTAYTFVNSKLTKTEKIKKEQSVSVKGYYGTEDGKSHTITVSAPSGAKLYYKTTSNGEWATAKPSFKTAGKYNVFVKSVLSGYEDYETNTSVKIKKKTASTAINGLSDIDTSNEFYPAAEWAYKEGIVIDDGTGAFRPWDACTRSDAIEFLWRYAGAPNPATTSLPFTDVSKDSSYYKAILWAYEKGIAGGWPDNTFRPGNAVTRSAFMAFLHRYNGSPAPQTGITFTDVTSSTAFCDSIIWAYENGIATGYSDGTFKPSETCKRAAAVQFLYKASGSPVYVDTNIEKQEYLGGYIEIQPDSWGDVSANSEMASPDAVTGNLVNATDSTAWGFPCAFSDATMESIKSDVLSGDGTGIMYVRFPLGFAYRGYRNIDKASGLAKNIGERWPGQNDSLKELFSDIAKEGGGLAPEYWCPPVYWLTSGSYSGKNQLWAGGKYPRSTTLASIRTSDKEQYRAQIDAFTNSIVDDLEYLQKEIAPVKQFGLQNEPNISGSRAYGSCHYDAQTYNDVLEVLIPKIRKSTVLPDDIKINVSSEYTTASSSFSVGSTFMKNHPELIDIYSWRFEKVVNTEDSYTENGKVYSGSVFYKSDYFKKIHAMTDNQEMFNSEYEYFKDSSLDTAKKQEKACSNNMMRMIYELTYGNANMLHPVIHLAKPMGQVFDGMSGVGYSLYSIDMKTGDYEPNSWSYNSWKMFSDNLPVGAVMVGDYTSQKDDLGWVALKKDGKTYLFIANSSDEEQTLTITFDKSMSFIGKQYDLNICGKAAGSAKGQTITFTIPANAGLCWTSVN